MKQISSTESIVCLTFYCEYNIRTETLIMGSLLVTKRAKFSRFLEVLTPDQRNNREK